MPINPQSPFTRIYADIETRVALQLETAARAAGKSKKAFIADAIVAACNASAPVTTGKKGKAK